jgi:hypothetical protein
MGDSAGLDHLMGPGLKGGEPQLLGGDQISIIFKNRACLADTGCSECGRALGGSGAIATRIDRHSHDPNGLGGFGGRFILIGIGPDDH